MKRALLLSLVVVFAQACKEPPPRTVVVECMNDAGPVEQFGDDKSPEALGGATPCAKACANFAKLGCPESAKLPQGKTCVETCKSIASISSFDPDCVARAKSVDAVRKCPQVTCKQ